MMPSVSCSARIETTRKKVRFCETIEARLVLQPYPADFFYTCSDIDRFRTEARDEGIQLGDDAYSSAAKATLLALSLAATMIAFFPLLLLLKVASIFRAGEESAVGPADGPERAGPPVLPESAVAWGLLGLSASFCATDGAVGAGVDKRRAVRI